MNLEGNQERNTLRVPLKAAAWIFLTTISKTISLFLRKFFQKIMIISSSFYSSVSYDGVLTVFVCLFDLDLRFGYFGCSSPLPWCTV